MRMTKYFPNIYAPISAAAGGTLLATGALGKCPVCNLAGVNTTEKSEENKEDESG